MPGAVGGGSSLPCHGRCVRAAETSSHSSRSGSYRRCGWSLSCAIGSLDPMDPPATRGPERSSSAVTASVGAHDEAFDVVLLGHGHELVHDAAHEMPAEVIRDALVV